jgi:carbohydrate-binding DOMON domain-containing protein
LTDIYKHYNNGLLPNWEEEEEIVLTNDEIGNITIEIETDRFKNDDNVIIVEKEKQVIEKFIVTLDYNLFFICDDNEYSWGEVSADELIGIFEFIRKKYKEIFG